MTCIFRIFVPAILLFLLCPCVYGQDSVIIIRHGEKPAKGDNLNYKGLNRSMALCKVLNDKISEPYYTYVPKLGTGSATKHSRMFQTVTPYAALHNLEISTEFDKGDSTGIAREVKGKLSRHRKGTILLVWEHHNIPLIARNLGVPASQVPNWDDNDYDSMWIITGAGTPGAKLSIAQEGLNGVADQTP